MGYSIRASEPPGGIYNARRRYITQRAYQVLTDNAIYSSVDAVEVMPRVRFDGGDGGPYLPSTAVDDTLPCSEATSPRLPTVANDILGHTELATHAHLLSQPPPRPLPRLFPLEPRRPSTLGSSCDSSSLLPYLPGDPSSDTFPLFTLFLLLLAPILLMYFHDLGASAKTLLGDSQHSPGDRWTCHALLRLEDATNMIGSDEHDHVDPNASIHLAILF